MFFRASVLTLLFTFGTSALAQNFSHRPTALEMLDEVPAVSDPNARSRFPFARSDQDALDDLRSHLPEIIARLELTYPGLTYVVLGRDTEFLGDMIDAFYLSLGKPNRVRRIEASRGTMNADPAALALFLRQNGVDFRKDMAGVAPMVFLDRTTYQVKSDATSTSQLLRLMSAIYTEGRRLGLADETLAQKFVPMVVNSTNVFPPEPRYAESFFTIGEVRSSFGTFLVPKHRTGINAGSLIDREATNWTESYGKLAFDPNGRLRADAANKSDFTQVQALALLIEGSRVVRSAEFRESVRAQSEALGFEFPFGGRKVIDSLKVAQTWRATLLGFWNFKKRSMTFGVMLNFPQRPIGPLSTGPIGQVRPSISNSLGSPGWRKPSRNARPRLPRLSC